MTGVKEVVSISEQARRALRREKWNSQGRFEAFEFALEEENNLEQLRAKVQEVEDHLINPALKDGPMAPNTSTRLAREGYLAGLKEAISVILATSSDAA